MSSTQDIIVGIDLGTTNSLVAVCDEAGPRVLRDVTGDALVPSFLCFGLEGRVVVGQAAKAHAVEHPTSTIFSIKRMMGQGYDELTTSGELAQLPYPVVKRKTDGNGRDIPAVAVDGRLLTPAELSALVLRELKQRASEQLGCEVRKAVITVPAYFDDAQRQATRDAGRIAGLEVVRMVNEPTAAALAYGLGLRGQLEKTSMTAKPGATLALAGRCSPDADAQTPARPTDAVGDGDIIAVYDLGGGTFDVSLLRMSEGVFEVLSTHGNTRLGGDDFDREIIHLVQGEVKAQFGLQIESPATRQALRSLAENVKIRLSTVEHADIEIDLGEQRTYRRRITREELEAVLNPWVEKTIESCRRALADAKVTPGQVDQVILVGGSTRIPFVRRRVREVFGREPYTAINPDEVVALGASVQAAILTGVRRDALLLDVIPLSMGIETLGGAMGKLILRNTRIPCQATEQFSTFVDGQTNVKINVLQGERELAKDCRSLGEFELRGIPPMPAGMPKLMVTFLIDENGILNVSAREERSGREASIQIVPTHGLTADEVKRMERESYLHAREDMTAHRLIDLRNQIIFDTTKTEQALAAVADRLSPREQAEVKRSIAALRNLAETETDADKLFQALTDFGHGTVRLAELAITAALQEDQNAQASTTRGG